MIALLFALFDSRPWPGVPVHPLTLSDIIVRVHARPRISSIAKEIDL